MYVATLLFTPYSDTHMCMSGRKIHNNCWLVAYTLIRNSSLIPLTASMPCRSIATIIVFGGHVHAMYYSALLCKQLVCIRSRGLVCLHNNYNREVDIFGIKDINNQLA